MHSMTTILKQKVQVASDPQSPASLCQLLSEPVGLIGGEKAAKSSKVTWKLTFFIFLLSWYHQRGLFWWWSRWWKNKHSLLIFEISQQDTEVRRSSRQPTPHYLQILYHLLLLHLPCFLRDLIRSSTPFLLLLELPLCRLVNKTKRRRAENLDPKISPSSSSIVPPSLHNNPMEQISRHLHHHHVAMCRSSTLQQVPSLIMRGGLLPLPLSKNHLDFQL